MYALVNDGAVSLISDSLPDIFGNMTGFHLLSDAQAVEFGWLAFNETVPSFDADTHKLGPPIDAVTDTSIERTYDVVALTQQEMADNLAAAKVQAIALTQAKRELAILAFVWNGTPVPLTGDTQRDIGNAAQSLGRQTAGATIAWEIADGVYVDFDLTTIQTLGDAAFAYVQSCYDASRSLTAQINAQMTPSAINAIFSG